VKEDEFKRLCELQDLWRHYARVLRMFADASDEYAIFLQHYADISVKE